MVPAVWHVELDVTESYAITQPGAIRTYHYAHFTVELDVDGEAPRDGHIRLASHRALARHVAGRVDGGRDTPRAHTDYVATLASNRAELAINYDDAQHWVLAFALPLVTTGTNIACSGSTCADSAAAALAPLGWILDPTSGAQVTHAGDTWFVDFTHDDAGRHRELHLVLRPPRV